jgi:hypothetical protein
MTVPSWDEAYAAGTPAPWDIGRPQPAFVRFSDRQPGDFGPRRVRQDELRAAFSDGWTITSIEAAAFEINEPRFGIGFAQAWLAVIERMTSRPPAVT